MSSNNVIQNWYADYGNALGKFEHLQSFVSSLKKHAPSFGYELVKCHLVVKPGLKEKAAVFFEKHEVNFIDGHRVPGSFIGTSDSQRTFLEEKATERINLLKKLAKHAKTSPQNVYKSITNVVQHKFSFITRTTLNTEKLLEETEKIIAEEVIPKMINETIIDKTLFFPIRESGLNLLLPFDRCSE